MEKTEIKFPIMGKVLIAFLCLSIFLIGFLLCIKPVSSTVIRQAFIDDAVRLRVNDVIYNEYPDIEIDSAMTIDDVVRSSSQLDLIVAKYLDALVKVVDNEEDFIILNTSKNFEEMNWEIIHTLEEELGIEITEVKQEKIMYGLNNVERQVTDILADIPNYIGNFGSLALTTVKLYGILTSKLLLTILALITIGLGIALYFVRKQKHKWLQIIGVVAIIDGIILCVGVPAIINSLNYRITNRLLGRSMNIDTSSFITVGVILIFLGIVICLSRIAYFKIVTGHQGSVNVNKG